MACCLQRDVHIVYVQKHGSLNILHDSASSCRKEKKQREKHRGINITILKYNNFEILQNHNKKFRSYEQLEIHYTEGWVQFVFWIEQIYSCRNFAKSTHNKNLRLSRLLFLAKYAGFPWKILQYICSMNKCFLSFLFSKQVACHQQPSTEQPAPSHNNHARTNKPAKNTTGARAHTHTHN